MVQRLEEFRAGRIEVADDEDDGPPWNALGDLVQDVRHLRLAEELLLGRKRTRLGVA